MTTCAPSRPRAVRSVRLTLSALAAIVVILGPAAPQPAAAKDLSGRVGVGIEQSLAGVTGFAFRYFLSDSVALNTTLGVDITLVDDASGDNQIATGLTSSLGVAFHLARSLHAHLGLGLRASIGWRSLEATRLVRPEATDSDLQLNLEIPLFLEFFLSDHFSVGVSTGFLINFVPASGATFDADGPGGTTEPGAVGIGIGSGSVTGTLSILYYF